MPEGLGGNCPGGTTGHTLFSGGGAQGTQDTLLYPRLVSSRYWCFHESRPVYTLVPVKELRADVA